MDNLISKLISERQIPGLSLAIVHDGEIVKAKGYGFADRYNRVPVTPDTLFQAASLSKPVTAFAALRLVDQGRMSLDAAVNDLLRGWRVPDTTFTATQPLTLRHLLSHSAGLTVHGFPGYPAGSELPSLAQILDGAAPANTEAVRVDALPGQCMRYSGGGYVVLQQLLMDVTGQSFAELMRETVLEPLGMAYSAYAQPLPAEQAQNAARGYDVVGDPIQGGSHVYPEMAAAGLWTTASDLARFVIAVHHAASAKSTHVLSPHVAREMLTRQAGDCGLGLFLEGDDDGLLFTHDGRNEGFDAIMLGFAGTGNGAAIMMNANDTSGVFQGIIESLALEYRWW